jgi:hypothetical protein
MNGSLLYTGVALIADFKEAPISPEQIRPEFEQVQPETACDHELLLSFRAGWRLRQPDIGNGTFGTSPVDYGKSSCRSDMFFARLP